MCTTGKGVLKLRNVYMITCASQGKLVEGCGMYISSRVHDKKSCYKVAEFIFYYLWITRKGVIKWGKYISPRILHKESW